MSKLQELLKKLLSQRAPQESDNPYEQLSTWLSPIQQEIEFRVQQARKKLQEGVQEAHKRLDVPVEDFVRSVAPERPSPLTYIKEPPTEEQLADPEFNAKFQEFIKTGKTPGQTETLTDKQYGTKINPQEAKREVLKAPVKAMSVMEKVTPELITGAPIIAKAIGMETPQDIETLKEYDLLNDEGKLKAGKATIEVAKAVSDVVPFTKEGRLLLYAPWYKASAKLFPQIVKIGGKFVPVSNIVAATLTGGAFSGLHTENLEDVFKDKEVAKRFGINSAIGAIIGGIAGLGFEWLRADKAGLVTTGSTKGGTLNPEAEKEFKKLIQKYHPDMSGTIETTPQTVALNKMRGAGDSAGILSFEKNWNKLNLRFQTGAADLVSIDSLGDLDDEATAAASGALANFILPRKLTPAASELLTDEILRLKSMVGGVSRVDYEGGSKRVSGNPRWYKDFYEQNGRAPNKSEWKDLAGQSLMGQLETGVSAEQVGSNMAILGGKERGFLKRATLEGLLEPTIASDLQAEPTTKYYRQRPNEPELQAAQEALKDPAEEQKIWDLAKELETNPERSLGVQESFRLQALYKKYLDSGDIDAALSLSRAFTKGATPTAQALQSYNYFGKLSPEKAVASTQSLLEEEVGEKKIKKVREESKKVAEEIIKINKEAMDQVMEDVKKAFPTHFVQANKVKGVTSIAPEPATDLAKKVYNYVLPKTDKVLTDEEKLVKNMIDTLFKVAKEDFLPKKPLKEKIDPLKAIQEALSDPKTYKMTWDKAIDSFREKYLENVPEGKEGLINEVEEKVWKWLNSELGQRTFAESQAEDVYKENVKDIDLDFLIRQHYSEADKARQYLVDKIVDQTNLTKEQAQPLVDYIEKRFNAHTAAKKKASLENRIRVRERSEYVAPMEKLIQLSNLGALGDEKYYSLVSKIMGIPQLTPEAAKEIYDLADKMQQLPEGDERTQVGRELIAKMSDQIPVGLAEAIDHFRYANMLSSPKSTLRNMYGNAFQTYVTKPLELGASAVIDIPRSLLTGEEREYYLKDVPLWYRDAFAGIVNGWEAARGVMSGEIQITNPDLVSPTAIKSLTSTRRAMGTYKEKLPGKLGSIAGGATSLPQRVQEAVDVFFRGQVENAEFHRLLRGDTDPLEAEAASKILGEETLFRTKQDKKAKESYLEKALTNVTRMAQDIKSGEKYGKMGKAVGFLMPFINTSSNILKWNIRYTPAGLVGPAENLKDTTRWGRALLGSIVMGGGALAASQGRMTTDAPSNKKEREAWYNTGRKPWSILIGNEWVPFYYFGPFALSMAVPAIWHHYDKESRQSVGKEDGEKLSYIMQGIAQFVGNQTALKGMENVFTMLGSEPSTSGYDLTRAVSFISGQMIPMNGLMRWFTTVLDKVYRRPTGTGFKLWKEMIMRDIPGLSKQLEAYEGKGGEPATRDWTDVFAPYGIGEKGSETDEMLYRESKGAKWLYEYLKENPDEMTPKYLITLMLTNKTLYSGLEKQKKFDTLGLSKEEKALDGKGVEEKVKFIKEKMAGMDRDQKLEFLLKMKAAGFLTSQVLDAMSISQEETNYKLRQFLEGR